MSKSERKTKTEKKKSRSKPERNLYEAVGGFLANAVWILLVLSVVCFVIGHSGWGWCFLVLSVVPVVLFLVFHVATAVVFTKTIKDIPHR